MTAAFVLFLLAGLSDAADGYLAKRFQWRTELGAYLDPIADKLLLISIYVTLGFANHLPAWLVIAVVSRDILIIGAVPAVVDAVAAGAASIRCSSARRTPSPRSCSPASCWPSLALGSASNSSCCSSSRSPARSPSFPPAPISGGGSGIWRATSPLPLRCRPAKASPFRLKGRSSRGSGLRDGQAAHPRPAASRGARRGRLPGQRVQSWRRPADRFLAGVAGQRAAPDRACRERQDASRPRVAGALGRRSRSSRPASISACSTRWDEGTALIVEDVDRAGYDEKALFHLLNLAREKRLFVLLSAREAPKPVRLRAARPEVAAQRVAGGARSGRRTMRCSRR